MFQPKTPKVPAHGLTTHRSLPHHRHPTEHRGRSALPGAGRGGGLRRRRRWQRRLTAPENGRSGDDRGEGEGDRGGMRTVEAPERGRGEGRRRRWCKEGARRSTEKVAEVENKGAAVTFGNTVERRMAVAVGYDGRWLGRWGGARRVVLDGDEGGGDEGGWDGDERKGKQGRGWPQKLGMGREEDDGGKGRGRSVLRSMTGGARRERHRGGDGSLLKVEEPERRVMVAGGGLGGRRWLRAGGARWKHGRDGDEAGERDGGAGERKRKQGRGRPRRHSDTVRR